MKSVQLLLPALAALTLASPLMATEITIPVSATAAFVTGIDNWSFTYATGAPGVYLQSITVDLSPTDVLFNTAPGGFGAYTGTYENVTPLLGTGTTTGLASISPSGAALDGGNEVTFTFNDFTVGDTFTFSAGVAGPAPTLQNLASCSSLTGIAKVACNASNALKTVENDAAIAAAETVLPSQVANAGITFSFGGPDIVPGTVTDPLSTAFSQGASTTVAAPEPATMAMMGVAGLALLLGRLRKRA
jgi:hypothetical protein